MWSEGADTFNAMIMFFIMCHFPPFHTATPVSAIIRETGVVVWLFDRLGKKRRMIQIGAVSMAQDSLTSPFGVRSMSFIAS